MEFKTILIIIIGLLLALAYFSPDTYTRMGDWAKEETSKATSKLILDSSKNLISDFFSVVVMDEPQYTYSNSTEIVNVSNNELILGQ